MKNIIIMMGIAIMCYTQCLAQNLSPENVPSVVIMTFQKQFPMALNTKWEIEAKYNYEATFTNTNLHQAALYNKAGKWLATETQIEASALPKEVRDAFARDYPGANIREVEHLDTSASGELYELEISKGRENLEIRYSPSGKMVKKEKMKAKD